MPARPTKSTPSPAVEKREAPHRSRTAPKEVIQKLRDGISAVIAQPRTREAFDKLGAEVEVNTADEFTKRMQSDHARWVRIRKETGLKID